MQREPTPDRSLDEDGYASSQPSSSASSVEASPTLPKRKWPNQINDLSAEEADDEQSPKVFSTGYDLQSYFDALASAAVQRRESDYPTEQPSELVEDPEHSSALSEDDRQNDLSLAIPTPEEIDLNRKVRVVRPDGEWFHSVVCPFDDKVHYKPSICLEDFNSESLAESDIAFSKEFAQLNLTCRVLSMALDPLVPLLDRFKFLCIVSFYLDEHFSKRLGEVARLDPRDLENATINLRRQVRPRTKYEEELTLALQTIVERQHYCLTSQLLPRLALHGVEIVSSKDLTQDESLRLTDYFKEHLRPAVTPILLDPTHPFPLIKSHDIYLYVSLLNPRSRVKRSLLFRIPSGDRLIPLDESRLRFVTAEQICLANVGLVCESMTVLAAHPFRVTRNTKISIDDESFGDIANLYDFVIEEVHRRRQAPATRLEVLKSAPIEMVTHLKNELYLDDMDVYRVDTPFLDLSSCLSLAFIGLPWLRQTMKDPVVPTPFKGLTDRLRTDPGAIFSILRKKDVLVEYPRDNFENSAILYLHAAARDPCVRTIKTVLYRGGSNSPIIAALIRAAKNGKEVSVVVELKASLDEVQNSEYARELQLAGCNVTYGIMGLKVHSKIMLVVRQEPDGMLRSYVNVSTGNFNPKTAKLYTDYSLFTCRKDICTDVLDVFNCLTGYSFKTSFRTLLVAPINMLDRFIEMIREETNNAKAGKPARIACQINGLTHKQITKELYSASQAGVRIDLIVRGPCRLRPGIKGLSENIRVHSWIGQILQHRRVYYFHAGGEGKYFLGSADWRTRNLTARVEVIVPVEDRSIRKRLAKAFDLIRDEQWIWRMAPDGRYYRGIPTKSPPVSRTIAPSALKTTIPTLRLNAIDSLGNNDTLEQKLPDSVLTAPNLDLAKGKRPRAKKTFQVDIKGNKKMVDKIAVGAIPIRFANGVESMETLECLMVSRGNDDPWAVPKGGRNEGESAQETTVRIAREKAGVSSCEEVANLGWILVSKRTKQVAVQTFVLLAKELGTFASTRRERRREWFTLESALEKLKEDKHDFSLSALERLKEVYRGKFAGQGVRANGALASTPVTKSLGGSVASTPPQERTNGSATTSNEKGEEGSGEADQESK